MYMYLCISHFHGDHERREMCMYVRQVINGVSNGTRDVHVFMCFMCLRLYV